MTRKRDRPLLTAILRLLVVLIVFVAIIGMTAAAAWLLAQIPSLNGFADWVQAIGATVAIFVAWFALWLQRTQAQDDQREETRRLASAVYGLSTHGFDRVSDRLAAAASPGSGKRLTLRELRTSDIIRAMRKVDPTSLPAGLFEPFVLLRSSLYAVNERISEVYANGRSTEAFDSAILIHKMAERSLRKLGQACEVLGLPSEPVRVPRALLKVRQLTAERRWIQRPRKNQASVA